MIDLTYNIETKDIIEKTYFKSSKKTKNRPTNKEHLPFLTVRGLN